MSHFILQYGFCIMLGVPGLFFVIVSYCAIPTGRSGVPLFGGFLIALGFLTSPLKWLALLGLVDYGYWYLPYDLIRTHMQHKRFEEIFAQQHYIKGAVDHTKSLHIRIPARNEELRRHYAAGDIHRLNVPRLLFAVCEDAAGRRFLLADRCIKGGQITISAFDESCTLLTGHAANGTDLTVEIRIDEAASR